MSTPPDWIRQARAKWMHTGQSRPAFAIEPGPGKESVWDYPHPPRIDKDDREVVVRVGEAVLAQSRAAVRVLETAHPPTFYLPPGDICFDDLQPGSGGSICEWKGAARYWTWASADGARIENAAWSYPDPFAEFEPLRNFLAFYPGKVECFVAGQRVQPQPGRFYGGWITPELVGPFKGEPGAEAW